MTVLQNYEKIMLEIEETCKKVGRKSESVEIIAVTKYVSICRTEEAIAAGLKHIGENRSEGLLSKKNVIESPVNWHFIGSLQTRKVKDIIDHVDYIHSLDRTSLAIEIQKRASKVINCFIQVNTSGEASKQGLEEAELEEFLQSISSFDKIKIVGLMTMAPYTSDNTIIRNCFRSLRILRDKIISQNLTNAPCTYLSMGMSNDFKIAIEEGATHIRIGSSLVGEAV